MIEKQLPHWILKYTNGHSYHPFPSMQLKLLTLFLIQGSQAIMIKDREFQPEC